MKKRQSIFPILTSIFVALFALVTSAYAAWVFLISREASAPVTPNTSVVVELNDNFKLYNADNDTEITNLYIICDAPTTATDNYLAGQGVYWSSKQDGSDVINNVYIKGTLNYHHESEIQTVSKVIISFVVGDFSIVNDYVTVGNFTAPANLEVAVADNAVIQSASFALPTLNYTALSLGISSLAEVNAMNESLVNSLNGKSISVTATIIDKQ